MQWFTSDLHLGHQKVSDIRGFSSVERHDLTVVNNWSRRVKPGDAVYVLGDVFMGNKARGIQLLSQLPGEKHLILGNHDRPAPNYKNGHLHVDSMGDVWSSISTTAALTYEGQKFLLSHYPYDGDHTREERYDQWRLRDLGVPIIHGHTHSSERVSRSNQGTVQVHAGLDAWSLNPVSFGELYRTFQNEIGDSNG